MKHIRDPLYGYISVSDAELGVIGTPVVQRLRGIHQLGLSSAVYPGATHTRFEHSIGVMHLAGQLADSLGLSDAERRAYRLAGLLHDVGHAPFSHATERVMKERLNTTHEEQSCHVVDGIANALGDSFPADPSLVKDAIMGESQYDIVSGDVDVDRMDYLRRDAHETGIPHGKIDTETIIRFAETHEGQIVFSHKSLQAIEDLFNARTAMTRSVYRHHTVRIVEVMFQRAVEKFLDETGTDPRTLLRWDDRQLHTKLLENDGVADSMYMLTEEDEESGEWESPLAENVNDTIYGRIATRDLYKKAFKIGVDEFSRAELSELDANLDDVHALEKDIADTASVPSKEVLVDPPTTPTNTTPDVDVLIGDSVQKFSELSTPPRKLADSDWRTEYFAVYSPEEHCHDVQNAAETVLF